jgi:hypothetical protein
MLCHKIVYVCKIRTRKGYNDKTTIGMFLNLDFSTLKSGIIRPCFWRRNETIKTWHGLKRAVVRCNKGSDKKWDAIFPFLIFDQFVDRISFRSICRSNLILINLSIKSHFDQFVDQISFWSICRSNLISINLSIESHFDQFVDQIYM